MGEVYPPSVHGLFFPAFRINVDWSGLRSVFLRYVFVIWLPIQK